MFFLTNALLAGMGTVAPPPASIVRNDPPAPLVVDKGKLTWFKGSFDELMAEASRSKKLVFLDFWTEW